MLNLHLGARPDERFHLQRGQPTCGVKGWPWLMQRVSWGNVFLPDGGKGYFSSYLLCWFIRWYRGNVKCDGTRTLSYWAGQLGSPADPACFVMTTTPKEMFSFRLRWHRPDHQRYENMGGI